MKNRLSVLNEKFRSLTRKGTLLISLLLSFQILLGQIPRGYYDAAQGKSGAELKTALYNTIKDHTVISYSGLWTAYQNTDEKSSGKIWDMYSDIPGGTPPYEYTYSTDQCGLYSSEGDCYNREHSFPKSWFNEASPMYSDLFHIYPTDGKVNGKRSNYIFGNVENVSWTSLNGSKLGTSTESGVTLTEFEPIDEYKGDFARTYFYMATRYENLIASWVGNATDGDEILAGNSYPAYKDWYVQLLLRWHKEDPVSQKEIDRNNAVYNDYQHNRNPFIDHPEYAEEIWGTPTGSISFTSTPITSATVNTAYSYNITATGGDGYAITISATTKPDWLTIASTGDGTANLSGTPSSGDVGTGNVVLSASDGTNSTTQSFSITVSDNTTTLSFTSTPITSATVNTAYSYNITATGGNGSTITISATTKPDWLTIASTGDGTATLSGTPSSGDVGTGNVVLSASDGTNSTTQSFSITVSDNTGGGNSYVETFENMPAASSAYTAINWTGDNSFNWNATNARTDQTINDRAICFKDIASSYLVSQTLTGGCSQVSFKHQQKFTGSGGIISLYINDNLIGTTDVTTDVQTTTFNVSVSGDFTIKLESNGVSRIAIDDLGWQQEITSPNQLPIISNTQIDPESPVTGQNIYVTSTVTDSDGSIIKVLLNWGYSSDNKNNSYEMEASGDSYSAMIASQSSATNIYLTIAAIDNSEDTAYYSQTINVAQNQNPTISNISISPANPTADDNVTVSCTATDPEGRIGAVYLNWGTTSSTMNNKITMQENSGNYTGTIPSQSTGTNVYCQIKAYDTEGYNTLSAIGNYTVAPSTSIVDNNTTNIRVYPNPTTSILNINLPSSGNYRIVLVDLIGKQIFKRDNVNSLYTIDVNNLKQGIYILKISGSNFNKLVKIVKQ